MNDIALVNGLARAPRELFFAGGLGLGFLGTGAVGAGLTSQGVPAPAVGIAAVAGGGVSAALGSGVVDVLARQRARTVSRYLVDATEGVTERQLLASYGRAASHVSHGLVGAALGAFCMGAGFASHAGGDR